MGQLVFQATLGGQVNLVGPNTASTFNINVPAVAGNMVTTGDTGTVSSTMLASSLSLTTPNINVATATTINGLTVGKGAGSVATNTAVGASALAANSTGAYSTAIGYQAAYSNTANGVTALGSLALYANTSGVENVALGGSYATTAALRFNTTGSYNTSVGAGALTQNTTASNNTAVGYQASYSGTTGTENTSVGTGALYSTTTGSFNVAIGKGAAYSTTTPNGNTAVGTIALNANTTGASNVAMGFGSLQNNTTASNNTAVGYQAGYSQTTGSGTNSYFGYQAGYGVTTGAVNTFIGYNAGASVTTGSKNTIIGAYGGNQGGLDIRTANNYIVLSDGDGNPRQIISSSGRASINTVSDYGGYLNILHNTAVDNAIVLRTSTTTYNTASQLFQNSSGGNAGYIQITGASSVSYVTTSDYRLKENIAPMTGALEKVTALKPVTYTWKEDGTATQGFIAHELQEVVPECVVGKKDAVDADGNPQYQGIDTSFLVATLTAAIQELNAKFEAYKEAHP